MRLTYIDSGVLITATRSQRSIAIKALEILADPNREFASSEFVRLEVLPKAIYFDNHLEVEFYETFFKAIKRWTEISNELIQAAYQEACQSGLSAVDALHVAAALAFQAALLIGLALAFRAAVPSRSA